ncbi:hypothetical protein FGB62_28g212 [Gracilaria domingensis]|nr:hypothetical protein FGB62_28g212 [Gracilaria domingensis]
MHSWCARANSRRAAAADTLALVAYVAAGLVILSVAHSGSLWKLGANSASMAPRRRPSSTRTSHKQSSISDFFTRKSDTSSQQTASQRSAAPRAAIRRPRRKPSRASVPAKREALPRNVKRITADTAAVQDAFKSQAQYKSTETHAVSKKETSTPISIMHSHSPPKSTLARVVNDKQDNVMRPMEIDNSPSPLTKEELLVEEAFRSLECSQDVPELEAEPQPQHKSPRDATSCSEASQSSSEDSDAELAKLEMIRTTRRSGRTSNPVRRFDPSHAREASVFGPAKVRSRGSGDIFHNPDTYLAKLIRERKTREREEGELQQMREDIEKPSAVQEDEKLFASMAKSEEEAEKCRLAAVKKYSAPLPLFTKPFTIPQIPPKYLVRGGINKVEDLNSLCFIHDMLVDVVNAGEKGDRALSILIPTLKEKPYPDIGIHPVAYRIVYLMAVFDRTSLNSQQISRDKLVDALVCMVENNLQKFKSVQIKLPTLMNTLYKYGATMKDWSRQEQVDEVGYQEGSLDGQIPTPEKPSVSDDFKRALRNLKRACRIAAGFIRLGLPLTRVIGVESDTTEKEVLCSLGLTVRILLSAFGNRLYVEVGEIITELLSLIPDADWPRFRFEAAKYLLSITTRFELHIELVAHLIPQQFERPRYLALDMSFLSFVQWCRGPSKDPVPLPVTDYQPSEKAKAVGLGIRSYCLADVVNLLKLLPQIDKNTDSVWAYLMSYQLRLVLSEPDLFQKRDPAELSDLDNIVQMLRKVTKRLAFDVSSQFMRVELDTLVITYQAYGSNCRESMAAILPNVRVEKKQGTLSFEKGSRLKS